MTIRLLSDYQFGSRTRPRGATLEVDAELGHELIGSGVAENVNAAEKKSRKKKV